MLRFTPFEIRRSLRNDEIDQIFGFLKQPTSSSVVLIEAESGHGKSTILEILDRDNEHATCFVDLGASRSRTALGVASTLVSQLTPERANDFFDIAIEAHKSGNDALTKDALERCVDLVRENKSGKLLFLLDNVDRASGRVRAWIFNAFLAATEANCVAAAREVPPEFSNLEVVNLYPFGREKLEVLSNTWSKTIDIDATRLCSNLISCSDGHPVKAEITAWALSLLSSSDRRGSAYADLPTLLATALQNLPQQNRQAIKNLVCSNVRYSKSIAERLGAKEDFDFVSQLPFVTNIDDNVGGVQIHSEAASVLIDACGYDRSEIDKARSHLASKIYPVLIAEGHNRESTALLELEKLRYLAFLRDRSGLALLEKTFKRRLQKGELWRADETAQIAEDVLIETKSNLLDALLITVENSIAHHDISNANEKISRISPKDVSVANAKVKHKITFLKSKCVTSPAAISGSELFNVAQNLSMIVDSPDAQLDELLRDEFLFEAAAASRLTAQYATSIKFLTRLVKTTKSKELFAGALEELSHLHRFIHDLEYAENLQSKLNFFRIENDLETSASGWYSLAALRRDQNDFNTANRLFNRALSKALEENDDYLACCILGEQSWTSYLEDKITLFGPLLEKYKNLSDIYGFSRELSEYWHMRYHLALDSGDDRLAYDSLSTALDLADRFGNVIMQLDCRMHLVQKFGSNGNIDEANLVIADMKKIEELGCGNKVFRGRAMIYLADFLFNRDLIRDATLLWKDGFEIVASFGTSRSNTEELSEIYETRRDKFLTCLASHPDIDDNWPENCSSLVRDRFISLRSSEPAQ